MALSALRHGINQPEFLSTLGKSARALEEYKELYLALHAALLPDKTTRLLRISCSERRSMSGR